ncbi:hypothetical protein [Sabulicella glaciei]|uniref:Uncharacterized protein n=1 Tax=Sabulicella glaciei TaxID=2984948 RepID=A0ABT3NSG3_9PROT|nr:hypothetical protein [Roseococcus sp. MDT2-1-1]MCW8085101.1 hypothetical protein [Roseococcus sp. MDT2-1-1]
MIIGAIEEVQPNEVSGWIHCKTADLRDTPVLAFLDGSCVGAGKVGTFRQDLKDAGLGDGCLGFRFGITLPRPADTLRVTVTLEGCEAHLLQQGALVTNRSAPLAAESFVAGVLPDAPQRAWLEARCCLEATQSELIETLDAFGVANLPHDPKLRSAEDAARELFEAVTLGRARVGVLEVKSLRSLRSQVMAEGAPWANAGLFVVAAERRTTLRVVEAANCGPENQTTDPEMAGAVEYVADGRNLVAVRRWVQFGSGRTVAAGGGSLQVFYPTRSGAESPTATALGVRDDEMAS